MANVKTSEVDTKHEPVNGILLADRISWDEKLLLRYFVEDQQTDKLVIPSILKRKMA
jgi:hypothetical protein